MSLNLRGVGVALVTPFKLDGSVDYEALERVVNHVIDGGVQYLVVQGTTGETPTLTTGEKAEILKVVRSVNRERLPIVLGHGGNNTQALLDDFKTVDFEGVSAILSASPNYNKPTQEGIFQHYKMLSQHAPVPIIVYNVPGRTASNILPETQIRLAKELDNVIAVKEASGDIEQKARVMKNRPEGFYVISGDDAQALVETSLGGDGVISVIGNAFPKQFAEMIKAAHNGDYETARKIHFALLDVIDLLFADGNPGGVKAALQILGLCDEHLRLPLVPVNRNVYRELKHVIKHLSL